MRILGSFIPLGLWIGTSDLIQAFEILCYYFQSGWRKWSANHPEWYAQRADAQHPDWYTRRVNNIRQAYTKGRLWPWELTSRPTEKRVYDSSSEMPQPVQTGYQAAPHAMQGQIPMPKWGLFHPSHYEKPSRVEPLPPIQPMEKHL